MLRTVSACIGLSNIVDRSAVTGLPTENEDALVVSESRIADPLERGLVPRISVTHADLSGF